MKTTIDLDDVLLHEAKELAARRGVTLRSIVEAALRSELAASSELELEFSYVPVEFDGNGLQPGVDLSDWQRIADLAYEGRGGAG